MSEKKKLKTVSKKSGRHGGAEVSLTAGGLEGGG